MLQDCDSGKRALRFGYSTAKRVADHLGAILIEPGKSNKAIWNNRKIAIKSTNKGNAQIKITVNILNWADAIIVAIQDEDGDFTIYEISSSWYRGKMKSSRQSQFKMTSTSKIRSIGKKLERINGNN